MSASPDERLVAIGGRDGNVVAVAVGPFLADMASFLLVDYRGGIALCA